MILARLAVKRPVLTAVFILIFIVLGWQSYQRLSLELIPDIDFPIVMVQTIYPGAGPEEVETQVTKRIEDEISTLADLDTVQSITMESASIIVVQFELGVDVDLKAIEVKDKVDAILYDLPDDVEKPSIEKFNINSMPVIQLSVTSDRSLTETYFVADTIIRDRLAQVPGVGNIEVTGGREREIHVLVHRDLAQAYGLSLQTISALIAAENLNIPGGRIIKDSSEYSIRLLGELKDYRDIAKIKLPLSSGQVIELGDIADVKDAFAEPRTDAFYAARDDENLAPIRSAVTMGVIKKTGANTVDTVDGVHKLAKNLAKELPSGFTVNVGNDRGKYIRNASSSTVNNIIIGIILTSLLLFIFLHNSRSTLIVAVTMPASLVATFLLLDYAGFTLNVISLTALGIAIGTLVTNAIVVLESITRHLELGEDPPEAAIKGTSEVTIAVIASTLTNVVVFTPIAFMEGIVGIFFKQFGLTIVFATLFSLVMSFTLIPMMAAVIMRKRDASHGPQFHWFGKAFDVLLNTLRDDYGRMLAWGMRHRWVFVVASLVIFVGGLSLFGLLGSELMPKGDQGIVTIGVELPVGSSLTETQSVLEEMDRRLRKVVPEIETISLTVGGQSKGVEEGTAVIDVGDAENRARSITEIVNAIRPEFAQIPSAEFTFTIGEERGGTTADLEVDIRGTDMAEILRIAEELKTKMIAIEGLSDVHTDYKEPKPEFAFEPERDQISRYGLTSYNVAMEIRNSYEGEKASRYREQGEEFDIRVMLTADERHDPQSLDSLYIASPAGSIPISQLGKTKLSSAESEINRKDKMRIVKVLANITQGVLGDKQKLIQAEIDKMNLGSTKVVFGGYGEMMAETFESIFNALFLAILLTFFVLAGIQESIVHPITIMITLPLGAVGAALALFLSGVSLNMMSLMAIVMLVGIVVNNAILIFDYTDQLRKQGTPIVPALIESAKTRLRPILMMNLAIVISMLPQTVGSAGSEFRQSMAVVTIGGVIVSMVFTLFLLPVLYTYLDRLTLRGWREHKMQKKQAAT